MQHTITCKLHMRSGAVIKGLFMTEHSTYAPVFHDIMSPDGGHDVNTKFFTPFQGIEDDGTNGIIFVLTNEIEAVEMYTNSNHDPSA